MTTAALKEAAQVGFPRDRIVGVWWACSEQDMVPAGELALGYICASFHATGTHFPLIQDILTYVYARGRGPGPTSDVGTAYWNRGVLAGVCTTEAIRPGQARIWSPPLDGRTGAVGARPPQHHVSVAQGAGGGGPERLHSPSPAAIMRGAGCEVSAVGRHAVDPCQ